MREGKTEPKKGAGSHERFLALDSVYCVGIRCSWIAHYVPKPEISIKYRMHTVVKTSRCFFLRAGARVGL